MRTSDRSPTLLANDSRDVARSRRKKRREKIIGTGYGCDRAAENRYPRINSFQPQIVSGFFSSHGNLFVLDFLVPWRATALSKGYARAVDVVSTEMRV